MLLEIGHVSEERSTSRAPGKLSKIRSIEFCLRIWTILTGDKEKRRETERERERERGRGRNGGIGMAMTQTSGSRCCKLRLVAYGLQMPGATTCSRQRVGRRCCEPMCHARPMDVGTDKSQALASKATLIQQPGPGAPRCSTDKRAQSPELWRTAGGVLGGLKGRSTAQTGQGSQSGRGRGDGVWDIKACVQQSPEKLPCSSKKKFLFGPWQAGKALLPDGT